jgi:hypothetical protein
VKRLTVSVPRAETAPPPGFEAMTTSLAE